MTERNTGGRSLPWKDNLGYNVGNVGNAFVFTMVAMYLTYFFTDFYLSEDEKTFQAMDGHVEKAHFLPGDYQEYGGIVTTPETAFTQDQLLAYADHCLCKCQETFEKLTDKRALERCGFWWYELNVGEFLLNNLRHTQHHTGQLMLLLRRRADIGIDWFGSKDNQPPTPTW